MTSGFERTSIVLTLCQAQSFQSVTPFCTTHLNQFCTECCLEVTVIPRSSNVSVRTPLTLNRVPAQG